MSPSAEGNMCGAAMQGADTPSWSKTPSRTKGTDRNLGDLASDRIAFGLSGPRREGEEPKPMMHGHEKSDPEIVASRTNADRMRREKPANKPVPTPAALEDPRPRPTGNVAHQP